MGAHIAKPSAVGASTLAPDGTLEIRTDQGVSEMLRALNFWFPDATTPTWEILSIRPADEATISVLRALEPLPGGLTIWEVNLRTDGQEESRFVAAKSAPTADEMLWDLFREHCAHEGKLNTEVRDGGLPPFSGPTG